MSQDPTAEALRRLRNSDAAQKLHRQREQERRAHERIWFVSEDGEAINGPLTATELQARYAEGEIKSDCVIWRQGLDDWQSISDAAGLFRVLGLAAAAEPAVEQGGSMTMAFDLPPIEPEEAPTGHDAKETAGRDGRIQVAAAPAESGAGIGEFELVEMAASRACAYMDELAARVIGDVAAMDAGHLRLYLAFELGVLEFYRQSLLAPSLATQEEADQAFYSLLVFQAGQHYPDSAEAVIRYWHSLLQGDGEMDVREIGFNSLRDGLNEDGSPKAGHYAADYLRRALGVE